jgi:sporulation protein YlmC with PRC-barrel domain
MSSSKERGTRLYGAMVIALAEGLRVGRVYEVYIDKQAKQIMGISYKAGLWGMDKEIYVGFADIQKFSRDVVIITGRDAAKELPGEVRRNGLRNMRGYKITTHAGRHIGEVADLVINREDGKIVEILLPENRKLPIDIAQVVIGPDLILIPADRESSLAPADPEPNDFVSRLFGTATWSETFRESYEGVRSSMRNNIPQPEKMMDSLKSGTVKARDTVLRTSQFIQHTIDQMRKRPDPDMHETVQRDEASAVSVDMNTERAMGTTAPVQDLTPDYPPLSEGMELPKKDEPPR